MNIESVEKLLAETAEARAYQQVCAAYDPSSLALRLIQEISDMLANAMTIEDEEAVATQLAQMEADALREATPRLPDAPVHLPAVAVADRGDGMLCPPYQPPLLIFYSHSGRRTNEDCHGSITYFFCILLRGRFVTSGSYYTITIIIKTFDRWDNH